MAETKYAVVLGLECKDPRELKKMTLAEARIKACRIAIMQRKKYSNSYNRVGIFTEDRNHVSAGHYMPKLIEDVSYSDKERAITGDVFDGFYLVQWGTNRKYRVSPKTGRLLDISRDFRYI